MTRKSRVFLKNGIHLEMKNRNHVLSKGNCQGAQAQGHKEELVTMPTDAICRNYTIKGPTRGQGAIPCPILIEMSYTASQDINERTVYSQIFPVQMQGRNEET